MTTILQKIFIISNDYIDGIDRKLHSSQPKVLLSELKWLYKFPLILKEGWPQHYDSQYIIRLICSRGIEKVTFNHKEHKVPIAPDSYRDGITKDTKVKH